MTDTLAFPTIVRQHDVVAHPALVQVERHWQMLRKPGAVPLRSEIDPHAIDAALPWTFVVHRVAPGVARIRVSGQKLHDILRMDPRGMPLSAFFEADDRSTIAVHLEAVFSEPALIQIPLCRPASLLRPAVKGTILLLPLVDHLGEITRAMGVLVTDRPLGSRRRIQIDHAQPLRYEPLKLYAPQTAVETQRPNAKRPALRLVVNNH